MTQGTPDPEFKIPGLSPEEEEALSGSGEKSDSGTAESRMFASGKSADEIKQKAEEAEANRTEKFKDHFENLIVCGVYASAFFFGLVCLCWLLNIIFPDKWRWLSAAEISKLQGFVTGGVIASTALGQIKKRIQ
ncbi:hypothetical protein BAR24_03605 [Gluconobacter oxydans]|uniref:hypothetical protein n=1 Tax=Gluconobacter thailandicus TaxID=257438 RepID=UPI0002997C80|nr:hypothetical protein [Gluconobacter thailandicus]AFW00670.1 hypothetical protein B932_1084 [Gluconobacter oxydans H24]ANQ40633.1 hypothetical protein BAR24_03605 [Gluconobacter oxydans]